MYLRGETFSCSKWKFVFLSFLLISFSGFSQIFNEDPDYFFFLKNYQVKDGLSESNVNTIFKDSRGIVWIGTDGGLNRFNSYEFEVFVNDTSGYSISSDVIYDITEDNNGTLWIATSNGLNKFIPETSQFKRFFFDEITQVQNLVFDPRRNSLWLALMDGGLVQFSIHNSSFSQYENIPAGELVQRLMFINDDSLVIGTASNGLYLLNLQTQQQSNINTTSSLIQLSNNSVHSLSRVNDVLIVGTQQGVNLINFSSGQNTVFSKSHNNFSADLITCSAIDFEGNIWIGTDGGGINQICYPDLKIRHVKKNENNEHLLQTNVIRDIFIDDDRNTWIGTYKKGFGIHNYKSGFLNNISIDNDLIAEIGSSSVTSFEMLSENELLIGVDGGGLFKWDGYGFERINLDPGCQNCNDQKILTLETDLDQNIWIGTYSEGLYCVKKSGKIIRYSANSTSGLPSDMIWEIKKDANDFLWMATNRGLCRFDPFSNEFTEFFPHSEIDSILSMELRTLVIDDDDKIWVGGFLGVFVFNPETESFERHYSMQDEHLPLQGNIVISLQHLKNGNIAIGTYGQGIQILDLKENKFVQNEITNKIGHRVVNFIEEDAEGSLWIGTNKGIVSINPEASANDWLNTNNGLQDEVFNIGASYMADDHILLAGGLNGFSILNTQKLKTKTPAPKILLEKVYHQNEYLEFNPYKENTLPEFVIPYSKTGLQINFTAVEYFNAQNINFSYKLESFDKDWSGPSKLRLANYTNLPPGIYNFYVKTIAFNDHETSSGVIARIIVQPVWWMTYWFRAAIGLSLIMVVLGIIRYRTGKHKKDAEKLKKAVDEKTSEIARQKIELENINIKLEDIVKARTKELNETINELNKTISELDRFVYSASHDLGAPLKSILGLINIVQMETQDSEISPHLKYMKESVRKLEDVISSLIQYSRNSRLEVEPKNLNLYDLVEDSYDALRFMHGHEKIRFINEIDKNTFVVSDENRLKVVIRNLLSNSVKYADRNKEENWIKTSFEKPYDSSWAMEISDNGIGIDQHHLENIFKMFYRANENSDGSGLGLYITKEAITKLNGEIKLESEVGKGTKFTVTFNGV